MEFFKVTTRQGKLNFEMFCFVELLWIIMLRLMNERSVYLQLGDTIIKLSNYQIFTIIKLKICCCTSTIIVITLVANIESK